MKAAELEVCKEVLSDAQKSDHGACAGVFLTKWAPKLIKEIERLEAYAASQTAKLQKEAEVGQHYLAGAASPTAPELELERESDGRWIAEFTRFPGVMAYGSTEEEAIRNAAKILPTAPDEPVQKFPDCNVGTAHECCVARMKRLEKERYGITWDCPSDELRKAWEQGRDAAANEIETSYSIETGGWLDSPKAVAAAIRLLSYPGSVSPCPFGGPRIKIQKNREHFIVLASPSKEKFGSTDPPLPTAGYYLTDQILQHLREGRNLGPLAVLLIVLIYSLLSPHLPTPIHDYIYSIAH